MLSDTLRNLRLTKGLTQLDIANFIGVTPQAVGKWERGLSSPDYEALLKLADFYNVSTDDMLKKKDFSQGLLSSEKLTKTAQKNNEPVPLSDLEAIIVSPQRKLLVNATEGLTETEIAGLVTIANTYREQLKKK